MKYQDLVEYIEVKYKNAVSGKDIKSLVKFMDLFGVKRGVAVTKDTSDKIKMGNKTVELIPAWRFLLADKNKI